MADSLIGAPGSVDTHAASEQAEHRNPTSESSVSPRRRRCGICTSADRDAIEDSALNGMPFVFNAPLIARRFGINISEKMLKRHMTEHLDSEKAENMAILMQQAADEDGDLVTTEGLMKMLLADAVSKVASGEAEIRSLSDVIRVLNIQERMHTADARGPSGRTGRLPGLLAGETVESMVVQLDIIMKAVRKTVPPEYLKEAFDEMERLGLNKNVFSLAGVHVYQPIPETEEDRRARELLDRLARTGQEKSREQLVADDDFNPAHPLLDPDVPPG